MPLAVVVVAVAVVPPGAGTPWATTSSLQADLGQAAAGGAGCERFHYRTGRVKDREEVDTAVLWLRMIPIYKKQTVGGFINC